VPLSIFLAAQSVGLAVPLIQLTAPAGERVDESRRQASNKDVERNKRRKETCRPAAGVRDDSVNAFDRLLELDDHLPSLDLPPQRKRPALEPLRRLDPIVFDHPLDAHEPIDRINAIN
jgi:hypothetical protein